MQLATVLDPRKGIITQLVSWCCRCLGLKRYLKPWVSPVVPGVDFSAFYGRYFTCTFLESSRINLRQCANTWTFLTMERMLLAVHFNCKMRAWDQSRAWFPVLNLVRSQSGILANGPPFCGAMKVTHVASSRIWSGEIPKQDWTNLRFSALPGKSSASVLLRLDCYT